jgi:hypothetical protein
MQAHVQAYIVSLLGFGVLALVFTLPLLLSRGPKTHLWAIGVICATLVIPGFAASLAAGAYFGWTFGHVAEQLFAPYLLTAAGISLALLWVRKLRLAGQPHAPSSP